MKVVIGIKRKTTKCSNLKSLSRICLKRLTWKCWQAEISNVSLTMKTKKMKNWITGSRLGWEKKTRLKRSTSVTIWLDKLSLRQSTRVVLISQTTPKSSKSKQPLLLQSQHPRRKRLLSLLTQLTAEASWRRSNMLLKKWICRKSQ